jgi:hypothetical protein
MSGSTEKSMVAFEESMKAFYASEGLSAPNASGNDGLFRQCSSGQYNTTMGYAAFNGWKSRDAEIAELREDNAFQALTITTLEVECESLKSRNTNIAKKLWMLRYDSATACGASVEAARQWVNDMAESEL